MRNMAVLHSPAFSYPLPVLVRVLFNLLIFKGKILYYNKYIAFILDSGEFSGNVVQGYILFLPENARKGQNDFISQKYFLSLQLL